MAKSIVDSFPLITSIFLNKQRHKSFEFIFTNQLECIAVKKENKDDHSRIS